MSSMKCHRQISAGQVGSPGFEIEWPRSGITACSSHNGRKISAASDGMSYPDVMQNSARSRTILANLFILAMLSAAIISTPLLQAQTAAPQNAAPQNAADPHSVPVVDGALGPCTADFTVTDESGSPVYLAKISVHIAYGFMYLHKMDLEVGTNVDGKARFTGLPARTKDGLAFQASKADRAGTAFVDPSTTCKADLTVVLQKKMQ